LQTGKRWVIVRPAVGTISQPLLRSYPGEAHLTWNSTAPGPLQLAAITPVEGVHDGDAHVAAGASDEVGESAAAAGLTAATGRRPLTAIAAVRAPRVRFFMVDPLLRTCGAAR
jgi:hypothetical protein